MTTRARRDRGATIPLVALALPVLILMTAFAVDLGRQRASRRTMQARADIVALDMIRLADGRTEAQILADSGYTAYLQQSADRNEVDVNQLLIAWGTWDETAKLFVETLATDVPNAVRVTASETTDFFFQPGSGSVTRIGIATQDGLATLTLGSTLLQADLGNNSLLNQILTGLVCGVAPPSTPNNTLCPRQANFSAVGYQGLANADVTFDDLKAAGGFGSVDELLDSDMTINDFARLTATALTANGDPTTAALYDGGGTSIASLTSASSATFTMRDVMAVQSPSDGAAAEMAFNPFNTVLAGLQLVNGTNFIDLRTAIPNLTLPAGISALTFTSRYQVIETPITGTGRVGSAETQPPYLRTAQIRLVHSLTFNLNISIAGTGVSGTVTLPVDVNGGGSEAALTAINCGQPDTTSTIDVNVWPRPVVGTVGKAFSATNVQTIGNVNLTVLGVPAGLVGLSAYGAIDPALQTTGGSSLAGIAIDETRSTAGSAFKLGGAITSTKLQTAVGGVSTLQSSIQLTLNSLLSSLDTAMAPAIQALGMSVSSSDVTDEDVTCRAIRLAA